MRFDHTEYITHGQIIPCAVGWVIVYKQPLGLWTEVAGPFSTREKARQAQKERRTIIINTCTYDKEAKDE